MIKQFRSLTCLLGEAEEEKLREPELVWVDKIVSQTTKSPPIHSSSRMTWIYITVDVKNTQYYLYRVQEPVHLQLLPIYKII